MAAAPTKASNALAGQQRNSTGGFSDALPRNWSQKQQLYKSSQHCTHRSNDQVRRRLQQRISNTNTVPLTRNEAAHRGSAQPSESGRCLSGHTINHHDGTQVIEHRHDSDVFRRTATMDTPRTSRATLAASAASTSRHRCSADCNSTTATPRISTCVERYWKAAVVPVPLVAPAANVSHSNANTVSTTAVCGCNGECLDETP